MKRRKSIAWKLNAMVIVIVSATLLVAAGVEHFIADHFSLELTRTILHFDSRSTVEGIEDLMMSRSTSEVESYFSNLSRDSSVYRGMRLVSHQSGAVVASRHGDRGRVMSLEDRICAACHDQGGTVLATRSTLDEILDDVSGGHTLSVVTPIVNKQSCQSASCHAHVDSRPILGFLQVEYSLDMLEPSFASRRAYTMLVVGLAVAISALGLGFLFRRALRQPIRELIAGTRKFGLGDFEFRFPAVREDELGMLEESFNVMASSIRTHEAELDEARWYLEGIIESSADIIITVSPEHRILTFNRGAEQALGYDRTEVLGKRMRSLFVHPEDRDIALERLDAADNVMNFKTKFLTKSGEVRNVLLTLSRLRDPQGNPIGTFGISKDVTEEKRLIQQLIQSKRLAAIGQTMTGIQHAIKNMLNALQGGAYLVRSGLDGADRTRCVDGLEMIEDGVKQIGGLSASMLNYARDWSPEFEDTNLAQLLASVREALFQKASELGVDLRCVRSPDLPTVRCDPKLVRMAMMDLATNAVDACAWKEYSEGESPEILLGVRLDGGGESIVVEISDNGCGMEEETLKKIFDPFFSAKKEWGTGLGLAMTTRVVELHGGHIDLDSRVMEGTTFRVTLPVDGPVHGNERSG